jgi:Tfp pilus assembly protein FimV
MALDIRRSNSGAAQRWLERELLALEGRGLIDATKERRPPHYHVAVFPGPQPDLLAEADEAPAKAPAAAVQKAPTGGAKSGDKASVRTHKVRRGESLWLIAQRYDCTVRAIKSANSIASNRLKPGQVLRIPAHR